MSPEPNTITSSSITTDPTTDTSESTDSRFLSLVLLQASSSGGTSIDCQLANGIIMSLAARGYVLWLINVVLAVCLIKIGARVINKKIEIYFDLILFLF